MTRRALLLSVVPVLGIGVPVLGTNAQRADGFIVTGELQDAGDLGYYAIGGESVAFMLEPDKAASMVRAADALVGQKVELVLRRSNA